ncbi:hypothetical protein AX16_010671 [Volvariella volvacea WC 439]|nr:hypothetical protein AX16_010671 [Volvariella volvacea WC 439]
MSWLQSSDPVIRTKTLHILYRVDTSIVESYYQQSIHSLPPGTTTDITEKNEQSVRLIEIAIVLFSSDGEAFALRIHELLRAIDADPAGQVIESAVELVLSFLRNSDVIFQSNCATTLLTLLTNEDKHIGPSLHVILSALACEYCGRVSISPIKLLEGLSFHIASCSIIVQEAALLSMLRIAAECESIPTRVEGDVKELQQVSRRHIRKPTILKSLARKAASSSVSVLRRSVTTYLKSLQLPDFAEVLRTFTPPPPTQDSLAPPDNRKLASPKLRYEAYAAPPPVRNLADRKLSDASSSLLSDARAASHASSRLSGRERPSVGSTPYTSSPQNLAVGDPTREMGSLVLADDLPVHRKGELASNVREDLIAFDAPSPISPPTHEVENNDLALFLNIWNSIEDSNSARGWSEVPAAQVVRLVQLLKDFSVSVFPAESAPFPGDTKILVVPKAPVPEDTFTQAVLRLLAGFIVK